MAQQRRQSHRDRGGQKEAREFDQQIIDIARVTRVVAGGKRMRFRACVVIGDRKGRIGYAIAKGADVSLAVTKAVTAAKKRLITIPIVDETIPHEVKMKFSAAQIFIKPAPAGTGVIAGGPLRAMFDVAGIRNVVSKMQGSRNKINNVKAVYLALQSLRRKP